MSGAFPEAGDLQQFWINLRDGKDCIREIPRTRWDWREWYGDPALQANKTNVRWGGFLDAIDEFDPLFFGISPREAELMDPQQRLLMTYAWKAIEDAGYSAQTLAGSQMGIFVGTDASGYSELVAQAHVEVDGHSSTGAVSSLGPSRMSFYLNVHGPSEPIETACSSSLVAIHRAIRALRSGECSTALVGGINVMVTPWPHISFSKAGMLCEDGRC
jgi:polyketide synthase PksN